LQNKGYVHATWCGPCGGLGWEDKRHALGESHRVGRLTQAARGVRYCDAGLWHLISPPTRRAELRLPQPPRRPPRVDAPDRRTYLDEVAVVVLNAIREQGAGLAMPPLSAICDRYQTGRDWTWRLRRALSELGWLRIAEHVYLTDEPMRK
jgi:hypothetical protein